MFVRYKTSTYSENILASLVVILGFSTATAVLSQIVIPLYPVPITGQTLGVLLTAGLLGGKKGTASVISYIILGTAGMPFFAGGSFGLSRFAGPTGGYLTGFIAASLAVGTLSDRGYLSSFRKTAAAMIAGNIIIYGFGLIWLSNFTGWENVLSAGIIPFIPGDIIKIIIAASLIPAGKKFLKL